MTPEIRNLSLKTNIILISGKAQHGKDTFADTIINMCNSSKHIPLIRCKKIALADEVKAIAKELGWNGKKNEKGRSLLQWVGDGARAYDPDIWIKKWHDKAKESAIIPEDEYLKYILCGWQYIFVTDVRYKNELDKIKILYPGSFHTIRVNRPDFDNGLTDVQKNNSSEIDLDDYPLFDTYLENRDLYDYRVSAIELFKEILCKEIPSIVNWFKTNSEDFKVDNKDD